MVERRQEQVPEAVPFQSTAIGKSVLEQPRKQRLILRQRDHAIADIARREHVEIAAQAARTAAIVRYSHNRRHLDGRQLRMLVRHRVAADVSLQPAQQGRESCSASNGNDSERPGIMRICFWNIALHDLESHAQNLMAIALNQIGERTYSYQYARDRKSTRL